MFEAWVEKTENPQPSIAEIKKAIRSENFPLNDPTCREFCTYLDNDGALRGNELYRNLETAQEMYLATKLLAKFYPGKWADSNVTSAVLSLRSAIGAAILPKVPQKIFDCGKEPPIRLSNDATLEIQKKFEAAIDRALDRLIQPAKGR